MEHNIIIVSIGKKRSFLCVMVSCVKVLVIDYILLDLGVFNNCSFYIRVLTFKSQVLTVEFNKTPQFIQFVELYIGDYIFQMGTAHFIDFIRAY